MHWQPGPIFRAKWCDMAYAKTPGTIGTITEPLEIKNIGIDGKTYQIADARLSMVQGMDLKAGEKVEYKIAKQGDITLKGKINFLARKEQPATTQPAQEKTMESASPKSEPRIITGQFIEKKGVQIIIREDDEINHVYTADLDVIKIFSKTDCMVKSGDRVSIMLLKVEIRKSSTRSDRVHSVTSSRAAKRFCKRILTPKRAETSQTDAALAQINKENAEGDARIKENKEFAESLAKPPQTVPATQSPKEPEKVAQNEAKVAPAPSLAIVETAECPVELKIHLDCGSYSNFDLSAPALPIDQAIARIEADGLKAIAMMHRMMAASKKGY